MRAARDAPLGEVLLQVAAAKELIALGLPHRALRLIRQTRPPWARDWPDEWHERTFLAAQALRALNRPRQALDLARIAATNGASEAVELIAELERDVG